MVLHPGIAAAAVQTPSSKDRAVQQLLEFFQLQGCHHLWHEIVSDKPSRDKLALIGDAALKYYVVKELVARNVDNSNDLHFRSQTYITNERLGLLQGKVDGEGRNRVSRVAAWSAALMLQTICMDTDTHLDQTSQSSQ